MITTANTSSTAPEVPLPGAATSETGHGPSVRRNTSPESNQTRLTSSTTPSMTATGTNPDEGAQGSRQIRQQQQQQPILMTTMSPPSAAQPTSRASGYQHRQEPFLPSAPVLTSPPSSGGRREGVVNASGFSTSYPSLARSPSTPQIACILLPLLCVVCHVIFYYGQTEPMWKLHVNATVDVWANATEYTARRVFDVAGLTYENHLTYDEEEDVQTFTYMYAIHELWRAKGLPGLILPRMAAVLLIVFSGLWPHLKLIMLNLTWFLGRHPTRRTRTLQWLSGLGKWSLADVLVVCVMVGVLHLDWVVEPDEIKQGVISDLPSILAVVESLYSSEELCDKLLKMDCSMQKSVTKIAKCKACHGLVSEAYYRPEWAKSTGRTVLDGVSTSGGGIASLRVVGMNGIYAFCGAVILSILLSLVVDIFDVRAKALSKRQQLAERRLRALTMASAVGASHGPSYNDFDGVDRNNDGNVDNLNEPLLAPPSRSRTGSLEIEIPGEQGEDGNMSESSGPAARAFTSRFAMSTVFVTLLIVFAVDSFSMERLVTGAGPKLLHEVLGMNWEKLYSLRTLMWTTGASGGRDYMLMGTFGLFCVFGPILRAVLLVSTVILDQCRIGCAVPYLAHAVNFVGSFCAWEVFAIAIIMVQMLMPSITDTIIRNPACGKVSEDGSCLKVEFNVVPSTFVIVVLGGVLLVSFSYIATRTLSKNVLLRHSGRGDRESILSFGRSSGAISSNVMHPNHNYHRLEGIEEEYHPVADEGLEELVFETNDV